MICPEHQDSAMVSGRLIQTRIGKLFLFPMIIVGFGLMPVGQATAQTFTILYNFTAGIGTGYNVTNTDGVLPEAPLILSGNALYGTAPYGGTNGSGTVFAVNSKGTGFKTLYTFTNGGDGAVPDGALIISGNTLYGYALSGGTNHFGAVFALNTNGTGFTNLYSFTAYSAAAPNSNSDGANPNGGMILSSGTLYGTAQNGGSNGTGTVFAIGTNGAGFRILHTFPAFQGSYPNLINSGGGAPEGGLILSDNTLYGETYLGGSYGLGTVFAVKTDGTGFRSLFSFGTSEGSGIFPFFTLVLSGNTLYGVTDNGGTNNSLGTVFAMTTNGTSFRIFHSFTGGSDGANPQCGLVLSGNTLYGGTGNTVFAINTNGTGFTTLANVGAAVYGLMLSGSTFYGTVSRGVDDDVEDVNGTLFGLSFPSPRININISGTNVNLTWSSISSGFSYSGYILQSTTNFLSTTWGAVSPAPVVVDGQYTVTNSISDTQQFYRLSQ